MGKAKAFINLKEYDHAGAALDKVDGLNKSNTQVKSWKAFIKFEVCLN